MARGRDPGRIGVGGEKSCLFGVGAEAGDDQQCDPVAARGRVHAVEGGGDVGAHACSVPIHERARVAATARRGRGGSRPRGRSRFGDCRSLDSAIAALDIQLGEHDRPHPHGSERGEVGKGEANAGRLEAVGAAGVERRGAGTGDVGELRHMDRIGQVIRQGRRREQSRQVVAHRAGSRDRNQIGRPLHPSLARDSARDRHQSQRCRQEDETPSQSQYQRLPPLAPVARRAHARTLPSRTARVGRTE